MRLLIVDDDASIRSVLGSMLGNHGWEITQAADGKEALARWHCDLHENILTDLNMPAMSGIDMSKAIRDHAKGLPDLNVRIVALTGNPNLIGEDPAIAGLFNHVLIKPAPLHDIQAALTDSLEY